MNKIFYSLVFLLSVISVLNYNVSVFAGDPADVLATSQEQLSSGDAVVGVTEAQAGSEAVAPVAGDELLDLSQEEELSTEGDDETHSGVMAEEQADDDDLTEEITASNEVDYIE